jgi:tetratricopeptide (TPR) repeat protein
MKKYLLTALLLIMAAAVFAQSSKVQTAIIAQRHGDLEKAKSSIDEAVAHPKTINDAKAWFYRGDIYLMLHGNEKFANLAEDPLKVSLESFRKCMEYDNRNDYTEDIQKTKMRLVTGNLYNRGVSEYMEKKFDKSLATFETLLTELPADTSVLFNAALSAEKLKNNEKTKLYFNKLLATGYKKPAIYQTLAQLAKAEKDTAEAINYLAAGRKEFPNEVGLVIDELNIYLLQNRQAEAIKNLQEAIVLDPKNASLYFALGFAYDKSKELEKAVTNYSKAIEIKPDYFDAVYNLGAIYFNRAAELLAEANKIPFNEQKKYDAALAKAKEEFKKAQPHLEKAHQLDAKDMNTLVSLQQMYAQLGMMDKSAEIKKKRAELGAK